MARQGLETAKAKAKAAQARVELGKAGGWRTLLTLFVVPMLYVLLKPTDGAASG